MKLVKMTKHTKIAIDDVREVICVALNYSSHMQEVESTFYEPPYKEPPGTPVLFIKPKNTIVGHLDKVQCPDDAKIHPTRPITSNCDRQGSS